MRGAESPLVQSQFPGNSDLQLTAATLGSLPRRQSQSHLGTSDSRAWRLAPWGPPMDSRNYQTAIATPAKPGAPPMRTGSRAASSEAHLTSRHCKTYRPETPFAMRAGNYYPLPGCQRPPGIRQRRQSVLLERDEVPSNQQHSNPSLRMDKIIHYGRSLAFGEFLADTTKRG